MPCAGKAQYFERFKSFFSFKKGLKYKEKEYDRYSYKGYLNKDDQREEVGITIWKDDGLKEIGEWLNNKFHGYFKVHYPSGSSYWGEFKDGNYKGYGTYEYANGDRYTGQWL